MSNPNLWRDIRTKLRENGVPDGAVMLPGDAPAWEGALAVTETPQGWTLSTVDYGRARALLSRSTDEDLALALSQYLLSPLRAPELLDPEAQERLLASATEHLSDLAARARDGGTVIVDVPTGVLFDRIGALDGYLLYPRGTSFEARSLPPHALEQPLHAFVTASDVRMRVSTTAPWFGRPGGGLRFEIENQSVGLRDLVREGQLAVVSSDDPRVSG